MRICKMSLYKTTEKRFSRDTADVIHSYERVDTRAAIYVTATAAQVMAQTGAPADTATAATIVADMARALYGADVITDKIYTWISSQIYTCEQVFSPASAQTLADVPADAPHQDVFRDGRRVAVAMYDVSGSPVYMRAQRNGDPFHRRYTFVSFFNTFVAPAMAHTAYDGASDGDTILYRLAPAVTVDVAAQNS